MKTRSDIQGLRALAVALVVLSHANLLHLTGGYVGVDVFFVISGYLITSIILREYAANAARSNGLGWFSLRAFYLRRFKRIVPAALLVLVTTTVASYLLFNSIRAHGIAVDALWSAFFLANLHFINQATDYFQQGLATSPLQHFWSLAVEEQFYLIFPTFLLGALSLHGIKIRNLALNWRRRIGILVGLISIASFVWALFATNSNPASSYFSSFSRAWELGLGASLAIFAQSSKVILPIRFRNLLSFAGFLAILISSFLFTSSTPFPGFYTLIPTIGAVLIIGSGINAEAEAQTIVQKVSHFSPITYLGNISYSVYLWHLPILILAGQRYPTDSSKLWFKLLLIASILLLSSISYRIYENPLRENIKVPASWYQNKFRKRMRSQNVDQSFLRQNIDFIAVGVVAIAAISLVLLPSHKGQDTSLGATSQFVTPTPRTTTDAVGQTANSGIYAKLLSNWQAKIKVANQLKSLPAIYTPALGQGWPNVGPNPMHWDRVIGASAPTLYVYGESTASSFGQFVLDEFPKWNIHMRALNACGFERNFTNYEAPVGGDESKYKCTLGWKEFEKEIESAKPQLLLALGRGPADSKFISTIQYLKLHSDALVYLDQRPVSKGDALVSCLIGSNVLGPNCSTTVQGADQDLSYRKAFIIHDFGGNYIDTTPWTCYQGVCPSLIDNTLVFIDDHHLTSEMTLKFLPLFNALVSENVKLKRALRTSGTLGTAAQRVAPSMANPQSSSSYPTDSGTYANSLSHWEQKIGLGLNLTKVPENFDPHWNRIAVKSQYWNSCFANSNKVACSYGNPNAVHKAVIMGDSFAISMIPMVISALDMTQWQVVSLTTGQCMIADVVPLVGTGQLKPSLSCQPFRHWAFDYLAKNHPDLVVLSDNAANSIQGPDGKLISNPGNAVNPYWIKQLTSSLSKISSSTKNLLYIGTVPTSTPMISCVDASLNLSASCLGRPSDNKNARAYEQQLTTQSGGIFLDPEPWLCYQFACPAIIDDSPVHPDGGHLGATFASKLGPLLNAFLKEHKLI